MKPELCLLLLEIDENNENQAVQSYSGSKWNVFHKGLLTLCNMRAPDV
jgi:hypothetical protein